MKKYILGAIVIILAGVLIYLAFFQKNTNTASLNPDADIIYFHGKGCPHCEIVAEFMQKNNIANVIKMEDAEIFFNKENAKIFKEKSIACGVTDEKQMGVPLLWVKGKCYTGNKDIVGYFEEQLKAVNSNQ